MPEGLVGDCETFSHHIPKPHITQALPGSTNLAARDATTGVRETKNAVCLDG